MNTETDKKSSYAILAMIDVLGDMAQSGIKIHQSLLDKRMYSENDKLFQESQYTLGAIHALHWILGTRHEEKFLKSINEYGTKIKYFEENLLKEEKTKEK